MSRGNEVFVLMVGLSVVSQAFDRSPIPLLFFIANFWQLIVVVCGVWKLLELFNNWYA